MNPKDLVLQVVVRPATLADAVSLGRVQLDSWHTTDGSYIKPQSWWARFSYDQRAEAWRTLLMSDRPVLALTAEIEGDVIGFAWCERNGGEFPTFEVELSAIHLLPSARGQGVGRKLMRETARNLSELKFHSLLLWTGVLNERAQAFYEELNGTALGKKSTDLGDFSFDEVAYGWSDLNLLIAPSSGKSV